MMVRYAQAPAGFVVDEDSRESSIAHADRASWVCVIGAFGYFGAALLSGQAVSGQFVIIMGGSRRWRTTKLKLVLLRLMLEL